MSSKGKLRLLDGGYAAYCPGCEEYHVIYDSWQFNHNFEQPTFHPSLLVRGYSDIFQKDFVCHSFIVEGNWRFLPDCSHQLGGQTVPMRDEG